MRILEQIVESYGLCPETGKLGSVCVTFQHIAGTASFPSSFKRIGFSCTYASEHGCTSMGETGADCPLFRAAKV